MAFFVDEAEVHRYVGGILRLAGKHPVVGPRLAAAETTLRIVVSNPDCELTFAFTEPPQVLLGPCRLVPDVTFRVEGDVLDQYWRGNYDLLQGLARGEVEASGRVSRVLKVLPHVRLLFPVYQAMVGAKPRVTRSPAQPRL
jgi:hypothetical protein